MPPPPARAPYAAAAAAAAFVRLLLLLLLACLSAPAAAASAAAPDAATSSPSFALPPPQQAALAGYSAQDLVAKIDGMDDQQVPPGLVNVKVGLLLPYSEDDSPLIRDITISGTSAVRLAFAEVNIKQELLPGAWITVIAQDSFGLLPNRSRARTNPSAAAAIYATLALDQAGVAAIIGDATSAQSLFSAVITSKLSLPQCSFSAGSSELSKKDQYSTFFRTVPADRAVSNVMVDIIKDRGWKRFGILHSTDILGEQMAAAAANRGRSVGLDVVRVQPCGNTHTDFEGPLQSMLDANVRIILLGATGPTQTDILTTAVALNMTGENGFVWVVANNIVDSLRPVFPDTFNQTWRGLIMVDNLLQLPGDPAYEAFIDKWALLNPSKYPMAGQRLISQNEGMAYSCAFVLARGFSSFVKNATDADVRLRSLGSGRARANFTLDSWNTGFTGPAGPMVFDKNGDVVGGNFRILNLQDGDGQEIGTWTEGNLKWQYPPRFSDGLTTPPSDSPPSRAINVLWDSVPALVIILATALPMICCVVAGAIIVWFREIRIFKVASPAFSIIELGGLLFAYAWILLQIGEPTLGICISSPLTIVAAYALVLGGIVVKNQRIYHIFDNVYGSTSVHIVVKDGVLARVCGTLFLIDSCVAALTVSVDLPTPTRLQLTMTKHLVMCKTPSAVSALLLHVLLVALNVGILGYATILSYRTRNVAGMYSECKQIALCVYNVFICTIVVAQSQILVTDEHLARFYLPVISVWVAATFTLAVLFGPKLWQFRRLWTSGRLHGLRPTSDVLPSPIGQFWAGCGKGGGLDADDGERLLDFGFGVGLDFDGQTFTSSLAHSVRGRAGCSSPGPAEKMDKGFALQAYEGVLPMKRRFKVMPFLSLFTSWEMKKVIVIPEIRYFIIIGTNDRASTISYVTAQEISRPGLASGQSAWHGFKATGRGQWHDYVFQVHSREALHSWVRRFDPTALTPANSASGLPLPPAFPAAEAPWKSPSSPSPPSSSATTEKRSRRPDGGQIAKTRFVVSSVARVAPGPNPARGGAEGGAESRTERRNLAPRRE